jgi:hypothetical protein
MFGTAGDTLQDVGGLFAAVGAIVVTLGLLTKAKPIRWLFRVTVGEPVTRWHRAQTLYVVEAAVAPIREQLKPNGGQSLRDRVDIIDRLVRAQGKDSTTSRLRDEAQDAAAGDHGLPPDHGAADRAATSTADDQ